MLNIDIFPDDIALLIYRMVTELKMIDVMNQIKFIRNVHNTSYLERYYNGFYAQSGYGKYFHYRMRNRECYSNFLVEWYFTDCSYFLKDRIYEPL